MKKDISQNRGFCAKEEGFQSAGERMRQALELEKPLQIVGTINAYAAIMAEQVGYRALYLSGAGVANYSYALPDLGITSLNDVLDDAYRITDVTSLPLLVDIDTGWGNAFNIVRTIKQMIKAGVAAVHIEDQVQAKRCGHRPNKMIVEKEEMVDRIKAAVDAKTDSKFVIMARSDALASEGMSGVIERAHAYIEAGADMIFLEAVTQLEQYQQFTNTIKVPVLANMTEFGLTPLFTLDELDHVGIRMVLYPVSAARAMHAAALNVYKTIREKGSQQDALSLMQSRKELYAFLHYEDYEKKLDELFKDK